MIRTIVRGLGWAMLVLSLSFPVFYFWASQPNVPPDKLASLRTSQSAARPVDDSVFAIVSYNIGYLSGMTNNIAQRGSESFYKENLERVVEAFEPLNVSIFALQEIDYASQRSYYVNQSEMLAGVFSLPYAADAVNWDKRYVPFPYFPPSVHFAKVVSGQSVLSRYPITSHERIELERVPTNPFYYDKFYLDRLAQIVTVEVAGKPLVVMNLHLEAWDDPTRLRQANFVIGKLRELGNVPVIILGDFNCEPPKPDMPETALSVFLQEKSLAHFLPDSLWFKADAMTYPSDAPNIQIDHIFYTEAFIEPLEARRVGEVGAASDHLPVLMRWKWRQ